MGAHETLARRSHRGAASVEAVIALSFMVLVLAATLHVRDRAVARHAADVRAHGCAFRYAATSCGEVPPDCRGVLHTEHGGTVGALDGELEQQLEAASLSASSKGVSAASPEGITAGIVRGVLGDVLSQALSFGAASTTVPVVAPRVLGEKELVVQGHARITCNLAAMEAPNVVDDAAKLFSPWAKD